MSSTRAANRGFSGKRIRGWPSCDSLVREIEFFYEIRDKGGVLRKLNVRVFFFVRKETRTIVVLGAIKKENNGPTPTGDRVSMRRRMRLYLEAYPINPQVVTGSGGAGAADEPGGE